MPRVIVPQPPRVPATPYKPLQPGALTRYPHATGRSADYAASVLGVRNAATCQAPVVRSCGRVARGALALGCWLGISAERFQRLPLLSSGHAGGPRFAFGAVAIHVGRHRRTVVARPR